MKYHVNDLCEIYERKKVIHRISKNNGMGIKEYRTDQVPEDVVFQYYTIQTFLAQIL